MGKGSPAAMPEKVRHAAKHIKQKILSSSSPSLLPPPLPSSSTPATTSTTAAASTTTATTSFAAQQLPSRCHSTSARPELDLGRVVEYTETSGAIRAQHHTETSKPWLSSCPHRKLSTPNPSRQHLINNVNLRGCRRIGRIGHTPVLPSTSTCRQSDSTANGSQQSGLTLESLEARPASPSEFRVNGEKGEDEEDERAVELTEEEQERQRNIEKCMRWIDQLPAKFSGMHILQERAPPVLD